MKHLPEPFGSRGNRMTKAQARSLARHRTDVEVSELAEKTSIESAARIGAAKVHAVAYVGQQAEQAVAVLTELEGMLAQASPRAAERLNFLGQLTTVTIGEVITRTARSL